MEYTKEIIKKAIEGGYYNAVAKEVLDSYKNHEVQTVYDYGALFLDPSFWQAVGRKLGWPLFNNECGHNGKLNWKNHQHRFLDHIQDHKDIESFCKQLIDKVN